MKGIVFTTFSAMVQTRFGLETWDRLLQDCAPPSKGIYTSGGNYPDGELFAYIAKLANYTKIPVNDLVFEFGKFMLAALVKKYPSFAKTISLKTFLMSIDQVIHTEVKKLHPDAILPQFEYESPSENELVMIYRSPRKLCRLAEGLIAGASEHFETEIHFKHPECMHRGDSHCRLELRMEKKNAK